MKKALFGCALALLAARAFAAPPPPQSAEPTSAEALLETGRTLHDQGHYEEAIASYTKALVLEPANEVALYELAYSQSTAGHLDDCVATARRGLKVARRVRPALYNVEADCLDNAKKSEEAIRVYQEGLAENPLDPNLNFNLAVAHLRLDRYALGRKYLKVDLAGRPAHASAHFMLFDALASDGYPIPAVLAALRFLSLEPNGPRADLVAQRLGALLVGEVGREPAPRSAVGEEDEGDFRQARQAMARFQAPAGKQKPPEIAGLVAEIDALVAAVLAAAPGAKPRTAAVWQAYAPFFLQLRSASLLEPLAYRALAPLKLPGTQEWLTAHRERLAELDARLAKQAQ